ncbi:MAG: hypothetical protein LBS69_07850 [Prevotellaceae bacterium]|jgi:hypothetical protein|nr:hypothetical protein [Prevotellaceae bacterium]
MTTNFEKKEKMIAMFWIHGGGGNRRRVDFCGFKAIDECDDWTNHTYIKDEDEDGNPIPEEEQELTNCRGNVLMDAEDLKTALETGIGTLDFDSDYDTTYTTYVSDLSEEELMIIVKDDYHHHTEFELTDALREYGFSDEEIAVANYFNDFEDLLEVNDYMSYYEIVDAKPVGLDKDDYFERNGKFYYEFGKFNVHEFEYFLKDSNNNVIRQGFVDAFLTEVGIEETAKFLCEENDLCQGIDLSARFSHKRFTEDKISNFLGLQGEITDADVEDEGEHYFDVSFYFSRKYLLPEENE